MNKRLSLVLSLVLLASCGQSNPPGASGSAAPVASAEAAGDKVLARVNGVPITETDVLLRLKADTHDTGSGDTPERRKTILDYLILHEIMAQKAVSMGLDKDPKYQEDLHRFEAQLAAFKRQELSERLLARESDKRGTPSDDEARAYFTANEKRIRTQVHVLQILKRSENAIVEARSMIERGGKSFEDVAASFFPNLPEGQKPWDLGYMPFYKIPEPWRNTVYDLKPGEMSGILRGPGDRYWLIKLVDSKEDTALTFESAKDGILQDMKANKVAHVREGLEKELRDGAKVEIVNP